MIPAHPLHPTVTRTAIAAELARELDARLRLYPKRVDSGRMTAEERDRELAMCRAWAADVARMEQRDAIMRENWKRFLVGMPEARLPEAAHGFTWAARRAALDRELGLRRRFYPEWIAAGRMTQGTADHRVACLEALAAIYDDGFDWRASNGARTHFGKLDAPPEIQQARREWHEHAAAVLARRHPGQHRAQIEWHCAGAGIEFPSEWSTQKEMAL